MKFDWDGLSSIKLKKIGKQHTCEGIMFVTMPDLLTPCMVEV